MSSYTRGEVVFLLSLSRDQAIDMDASQRDSCADLKHDDEGGRITGAVETIPVIARWVDVQRVKRKLIADKEALAIMQLRAGGYSERTIAELSGRDRMAVRRRWHATIDEIWQSLGGAEPDMTLSHIDLCLKCGLHPRVRLAAVKRRVRGGWKELLPERQASCCATCLDPMLSPRIIRALAAAA